MVKELVMIITGESNKHMNEKIVETAERLRDRDYFFIACHRGKVDSPLTRKIQSLANICEIFPAYGIQRGGIHRACNMISEVGEQIKRGFEIALRETPKVVIYMEGDKYTFVDNIHLLSSPILDHTTDVTIATRSKGGFREFPLIQRVTEGFFNRCTDLITGLNIGDYTYGPKGFSSQVSRFVLEDSGWGWGSIIYPIVRAARKGMKVSPIEVEGYPPKGYMEKYGDDFGHLKHLIWRILQGISNLDGLKQGLSTNKD